ncbi:MAG: hypothetical protein HQ557_05130 [Bacteroidetes bacterium]|nr:hypothetical protein [Bacteroidota bacterium]
MEITGKERITAILEGKPVDRVPLWLMDSFARIPVDAVKIKSHHTADLDDHTKLSGHVDPIDPWTEQWMLDDPNFTTVRDRYWETCELFYEYKKLSPYGYCNRFMSIPDPYISKVAETYTDTRKTCRYRISTPKGNLYYTIAWDKNVATPWQIEHPLKNVGDAKKLLSIKDDQVNIDISDFRVLESRIGDRGVMLILINTPMVTVSSAFTFEDYMVLTITEPSLVDDMIATAYTRIKNILQQCLKAGLGPIYRIMGSEQATPPMGSSTIYEKHVHDYEKRMISLIHAQGQFAAVHCHGNIKRVLPSMVKAGVDLLDPVEAPPSGDISYADAVKLAANQITLAGNIQYEDLASCTPGQINSMVKKLFADGRKDHKIVSCTGYPITSITDNMRDNYLALIDAVHKYGIIETNRD